MNSPKSAAELLDLAYLHMRSALLETAASFDRIQRASGGDSIAEDERLVELREAAALLAGDEPDRAARMLELFSARGEREA
jgi:hypothetical protein